MGHPPLAGWDGAILNQLMSASRSGVCTRFGRYQKHAGECLHPRRGRFATSRFVNDGQADESWADCLQAHGTSEALRRWIPRLFATVEYASPRTPPPRRDTPAKGWAKTGPVPEWRRKVFLRRFAGTMGPLCRTHPAKARPATLQIRGERRKKTTNTSSSNGVSRIGSRIRVCAV